MSAIPETLSGQALTWYFRLSDDIICCWDKLKSALVEKFTSDDDKLDCEESMARRMKHGESIASYSDDIWRLVELSGCPEPKRTKIFLAGLNHSLASYTNPYGPGTWRRL